jgi:hypothetical protein
VYVARLLTPSKICYGTWLVNRLAVTSAAGKV